MGVYITSISIYTMYCSVLNINQRLNEIWRKGKISEISVVTCFPERTKHVSWSQQDKISVVSMCKNTRQELNRNLQVLLMKPKPRRSRCSSRKEEHFVFHEIKRRRQTERRRTSWSSREDLLTSVTGSRGNLIISPSSSHTDPWRPTVSFAGSIRKLCLSWLELNTAHRRTFVFKTELKITRSFEWDINLTHINSR